MNASVNDNVGQTSPLNKLDKLRDAIARAGKNITELLDNHSVTSHQRSAEISEQLKNIGMASVAVNMDMLWHLCAELADYQEMLSSNRESFRVFGGKLLVWIGDLISFLERPDDDELVARLFAPVPEQRLRGLRSNIQNIAVPVIEETTLLLTEADLGSVDEVILDAPVEAPPVMANEVEPEPEVQLTQNADSLKSEELLNELSDLVADDNDTGIITDDDLSDLVADSNSSGMLTDDDLPEMEAGDGFISDSDTPDDEEQNVPSGFVTDEAEIAKLFGSNTSASTLIDVASDSDLPDEVAIPQEDSAAGLIADDDPDFAELFSGEHSDDDVSGLLVGDGVCDSDNAFGEFTDESASDSDDDVEFDAAAAFGTDDDAPDPEDLLGVLSAELADVTEQLDVLQKTITGTEKKLELNEAVEGYTDIAKRLMIASEALGLSGLHDLCEFIHDNVNCTTSLALAVREKLSELLQQWPAMALTYLNDPSDDAACMALIKHLENSAWPTPLAGDGSRDLFMALNRGMSELEDLEEEDVRQTTAEPADMALNLADDIDQELLDAFLYEAPANTELFNSCVMKISKGEDLVNNINQAQRIAHTLKGAANMVGVKGIANLTHHLEDILEYLYNRQIVPPDALSALIQDAADCLEAMIETVQGQGQAPGDALQIYQRVLDWANRFDKGQFRADDRDNKAFVSEDKTDEQPSEEQAVSVSQEVMRVPVMTVDEMLGLVEEESISMGQVQERLNRIMLWKEHIRNQNEVIQQRRFELEDLINIRGMSTVQQQRSIAGGIQEGFDSLEMDQYDELYTVAQTYIEAVADSQELSHMVHSELDFLDRLFAQQQRLNKELQQKVMTTRMVKVDSIGARLNRTVRQAARITDKKIELVLEGSDIMIDNDMLNKIVDPLMHLLRNAVDHGIESAEERFDAEKPETGTVTVSFNQQGNYVLITCADDGKGLDYEAILETAVRKGLVEPDIILDEKEIALLILVPGFSTRSTATQISGRGVGMDVVHNIIKELKGSLDIGLGENGGTEFTIRLPITLVSNHCLVVKVHDTRFAIPTESLEKILASQTGEMRVEEGISIYSYNGEIYRSASLGALVGMPGSEIDNNMIVLMVPTDNDLVAVAVNEVLDSYDLIIKSTGNYVKNVRGVNGVSLLGDGSVIPVLDIPSLLQKPAEIYVAGNVIDTSQNPVTDVPNVLIVDDSLSVRKTLSQLVTDAGYNAILAHDGLEATELLESNKAAVALVDMEMPRMNGLELTRYIRSNDGIQSLPIIMITSRTQKKHREQAKLAGVDVYLTKPYTDEDLLEKIDTLLGEG